MIEKYINDSKIKTGLAWEMDMNFLNSLPHKIYDFDDGFALFAEVKGIAFASCGFLDNSKDVFKKCKQAITDYTRETGLKVHASVHKDNKKSRSLINALGFRFLCNASADPEARLYRYEA